MRKERADKVLAFQGLVESREKAQALIMAGVVFSGGQRIEKPGQEIAIDQKIFLKERIPYVGRGGLKLEEALNAFRITVKGKVAADLGASTGGFTDCLLQRGAKKVYAVDVDTSQIDWQLRGDSRVILVKKNARFLKRSDFKDILDVVTMDLSFISVLKVLPAVKGFLGWGNIICLLKPQFEAGKGQVGKKGIVKDPALHEEVLTRIIGETLRMGFRLRGLIRSPIRGQKGNREFFIFLSLVGEPLGQKEIHRLIEEAVWDD